MPAYILVGKQWGIMTCFVASRSFFVPGSYATFGVVLFDRGAILLYIRCSIDDMGVLEAAAAAALFWR